MNNTSIREELERLKAELEALSSVVAEEEASAADPKTDETSSPQSNSDSESVLKRQFHEVFESLEHELRELPAITCLVVFTLGIILGRNLR
ncbi:MAG: hypothetical protein CMJ77_06555 [Planctomycetaceae bacterium]|nr:hypothetical protein [Planctomycetaceae bacterium]|tara:strand:+ start:240 stop:512 length:273 start_codon:yes stop_codon:yes gene_type:complete